MEEYGSTRQGKGSSSTTSILLGIGLVLAVLAASFFGYQWNAEKRSNAMLRTEVDSLETVRDGLMTEVNSLQLQYASISMENDSLRGSMFSARGVIAQLEEQLRRTQRRATTDATALRDQIGVLEGQVSSMQMAIDSLMRVNQELRSENETLKEALTAANTENVSLKGRVDELQMAKDLLERRTSQLADQAFRTSAMQVNVMRNNEKTTIKSGRVKRIKVSFDLVEVPEEYHGEQTLYLTITDANGNPVSSTADQIRVGRDRQSLVINVLESKKLNVKQSQRIDFTHDLDEKMKKGYVVISIYADKGLLGSTMYQLL